MDLYYIVKKSENPNREKLDALLRKSIEKYTFLSANDFEVMRTKKPVLSHLMVQVIKMSIFEMVKTGIIVTGFNNLFYKGGINECFIIMVLVCAVSVAPNIKQVSPYMCFLGVIMSIFIKNWYF